MENLLKEIIANNAIEYNKEESQDRAFIYVDDFINELKIKFKLLNLHDVSNNEAKICKHCGKYKRLQGNGMIHPICECGSEVSVGCHTCKHNPHAPFVPEICDKCNPETLSEWQPTDC